MFYYILGACVSGLLFLLLTFSSSFYEFLIDNVENAKNEIKSSEKYNTVEKTLLDGVDNNSVINCLNWTIAILSWIGLLLVLYYIIAYLFNK